MWLFLFGMLFMMSVQYQAHAQSCEHYSPGVIGDIYWGATGTMVGTPLIFGGQ